MEPHKGNQIDQYDRWNPIKTFDYHKWDPKKESIKNARWNSIKTFDYLKWDLIKETIKNDI